LIWSDLRVLVTGGAGFIGSHLAKKLLALNADVHVADDLSRGSLENIEAFVDEIVFHKVDLTSIENCLMVSREMDVVFHLAASVGGIHFIEKENVGGCRPSLLMNSHMLEAARINDVERFLFASSACIYKERISGMNRFKEDDAYPADPHTTYGWAKLMGEIQCKAYHVDFGIKSSIARIFNAYGENENLDPKWSHVIPSLIRKSVLYPKEEFKIFGDGKQERAFLYVEDCVEGLLFCMERIENADPVNLGSEEIISIKELAQKIVDLSGKNIRLEHNMLGPQGTHRYCADSDKMKKLLGWSPKTPLDEGLKRTYDWIEKRLGIN
jgi:nucleoside-diphosphate-sugar epimerase